MAVTQRKLQIDVDPVDLDARAQAIRAAASSAAIEGLTISNEAKSIADDFGSGAIESDEMVERIRAMYIPGA